jgi:hypothetical protein
MSTPWPSVGDGNPKIMAITATGKTTCTPESVRRALLRAATNKSGRATAGLLAGKLVTITVK